jgi:hypothetical protein
VKAAAALAIATLATALAGCGGAYTKHDFIARADAICASAVRQARSIPPPPSSAGQDSAVSSYLRSVIPIMRSETRQLRALKPAGDTRDRATLARWLGALQRDISTYAALAAAAKRGDQQAVSSAEASLRASPTVSLASAYGLRACSAPGSTSAS